MNAVQHCDLEFNCSSSPMCRRERDSMKNSSREEEEEEEEEGEEKEEEEEEEFQW